MRMLCSGLLSETTDVASMAPGALAGVAMAKSRSSARRRTLMSASLSAPVIDFWCLHNTRV